MDKTRREMDNMAEGQMRRDVGFTFKQATASFALMGMWMQAYQAEKR